MNYHSVIYRNTGETGRDPVGIGETLGRDGFIYRAERVLPYGPESIAAMHALAGILQGGAYQNSGPAIDLFRPRLLDPSLAYRNSAADPTQYGAQLIIDTLSYIMAGIKEQKNQEIDFGENIPVNIGEGAWASDIFQQIEAPLADDGTPGWIHNGSSNTQIQLVETSIDSVQTPVLMWARGIQYGMAEIQQCLRAGRWDVMAAKLRGLYKKWMIDMQRTAYLGEPGAKPLQGLLAGNSLTASTFIPGPISAMDAAEFSAFVQGILVQYRSNTDYTARPNRFLLPEDDFLGLVAPLEVTAGTIAVSKMTYLRKALDEACPGIEIASTPYGMPDYNETGKHVYALYRNEEDSLLIENPVPFTTTGAFTGDGLNFRISAYAQATGILFNRPLETLLFTY